MKIESLEIRRLRNVAPGTVLAFGNRGAVLLGKNGAGKTTLLNTIVALCSLDIDVLGGGPIDIGYRLRCSNNVIVVVEMASLEEEHRSALPEALAVALRRSSVRKCDIRISLTMPSGAVFVAKIGGGASTLYTPSGEAIEVDVPGLDGWRLLFGLVPKAGADQAPLTSALVELYIGSRNLTRFDEGLDYFALLTEQRDNGFSVAGYGDAGSLQVDAVSIRLASFHLAQGLLDSMEESAEHDIALLTNSSYLEDFVRLAGFTRATLSCGVDSAQEVKGQKRVQLGPIRYFIRRSDSDLLAHRHLSFGQKRLLGFLHYLECNSYMVVADELVNGLHYDWIAACLDSLRTRQAFVSSQNPMLFDFLSFDSRQEVVERFVTCSLDEQGRFVWRNLADDDARRIYDSYVVGIQHVSEILRTIGYW